MLKRLLTPKGVLFVAPGGDRPAREPRLRLDEPAAGVRVSPKRRALRPTPKQAGVPSSRLQPVASCAAPAPALRRRAARPLRRRLPRHAAGLAAEPSADIDEAMRLADQGHFVEAATCCEEHLRQHGPSAAAFYLLGLVRDATGNHAEAAAYYRKALYLDPNHYETQIHLALLMEKQGDAAGAQVLRNRARRLEQQEQGVT